MVFAVETELESKVSRREASYECVKAFSETDFTAISPSSTSRRSCCTARMIRSFRWGTRSWSRPDSSKERRTSTTPVRRTGLPPRIRDRSDEHWLIEEQGGAPRQSANRIEGPTK